MHHRATAYWIAGGLLLLAGTSLVSWFVWNYWTSYPPDTAPAESSDLATFEKAMEDYSAALGGNATLQQKTADALALLPLRDTAMLLGVRAAAEVLRNRAAPVQPPPELRCEAPGLTSPLFLASALAAAFAFVAMASTVGLSIYIWRTYNIKLSTEVSQL